jgi:hypothetical protein
MRCVEILQSLLGDDQLLHLSLPCHQSDLLVPHTGLPTISVELPGQDIGVGVLQSFSLLVEVGLMTLKSGLVGAEDLEVVTECDVVQLFPLQQPPLPLQQLPLQLFHIPCPLVDLACVHGEVIILLDDDTGPGLA